MALQASGAISLEDIRGEFNDLRPGGDFLSEYYSVASGIPRKGQEISLSDFYGKTNLLMNVVYENTNPNLELVVPATGRPYEAPVFVTISTTTAAEFNFTQQGTETRADGVTYNRWYQNYGESDQDGPFYEITEQDGTALIKRSSAPILTPVSALLTTSNAAEWGYTVTSEYQGSYRKWNQSGGYGYQTPVWQGPDNKLYHQTVTVDNNVRDPNLTTVTSSNAQTNNYWYGFSGVKYIKTSTQDYNGYWQYYISGTTNYYYAQDGGNLYERRSSVSTVEVTTSNATKMGYTRIGDTVDGYIRWRKNGVDYWQSPTTNKLYTKTVTPITLSDRYDSNNYWKINVGNAITPFTLTIALEGVVRTFNYTAKPSNVSTQSVDGSSVTKGSLRSSATSWDLGSRSSISGAPLTRVGNIEWLVNTTTYTFPEPDQYAGIYIQDNYHLPFSKDFYNYRRTGGSTEDYLYLSNPALKNKGTIGNVKVVNYVTSDVNNYAKYTEVFLEYENKIWHFKRFTDYFYSSTSTRGRAHLYTPTSFYPEVYGVTSNSTRTTYAVKSDNLTTYTYINLHQANRRITTTTYSYPYQVPLSRIDTSYTYGAIQKVRPEVLAISNTPQFTYDDARGRLYRVSTSDVAGSGKYELKTDWPAATATGYNWRNGRTVQSYYLEQIELINNELTPTTIKLLQPSGTLINAGVSTPQRMNFSANSVAELTSFFYRLNRSDANAYNAVNLGYVAPMGGNYPTLTVSGTSVTVGNLESGETYRLKWYGYQETKLAESGGSAAASTGTSSEFTSASIPSFTLSGGDDTRKGMDFYLEKQVSSSPSIWAVVRCFEYFQDTNVSDLFGAGQNSQVVACDFLDLFANGRS
jgi:hypothetical protein